MDRADIRASSQHAEVSSYTQPAGMGWRASGGGKAGGNGRYYTYNSLN